MFNGNLGEAPYQFLWNSNVVRNNAIDVNLCGEDFTLSMVDANNCEVSRSGTTSLSFPTSRVYPNPFTDRFSASFSATKDAPVLFQLVDMNGKLIREWNESGIQTGENQFSFSTSALESGVYSLIISQEENVILEEKLLKVE